MSGNDYQELYKACAKAFEDSKSGSEIQKKANAIWNDIKSRSHNLAERHQITCEEKKKLLEIATKKKANYFGFFANVSHKYCRNLHKNRFAIFVKKNSKSFCV